MRSQSVAPQRLKVLPHESSLSKLEAPIQRQVPEPAPLVKRLFKLAWLLFDQIDVAVFTFSPVTPANRKLLPEVVLPSENCVATTEPIKA
jgi:hypothetical protein